MKILFIGNEARSSYTAWSVLMQSVQSMGHEILCCVPHEEGELYINKLQAHGFKVITYSLKRKSINPLWDIKSAWDLYKILKLEKPHKVFASTIKPVIYGNIAARLAKNPQVYSCISGLGYCFEASQNIFKKLLHILVIFLYKIALKQSRCVFFQNKSDQEVFLQKSIISKNTNAVLCNGTGVDIEHFAFQGHFPKDPTFLLIARLLHAKGIADFVEAAKIIKQKYPKACFQLLGPSEKGYGAIKVEQILLWQEQGYIEYLGETQDVRDFIAKASVVVLPSYREGLPCSLMEAMSMGRPIVATDVAGCRELVQHGKNGYLVATSDFVALANALERFILEPQSMTNMGLAGRQLAEEFLDAKKVCAQIMQHMHITLNGAK